MTGTTMTTRDERADAERLDDHQRQVGAQHDEVAMRDVDQPHDAEHQRQTRREQRIEPAEKDALHDDVEPFHASTPK